MEKTIKMSLDEYERLKAYKDVIDGRPTFVFREHWGDGHSSITEINESSALSLIKDNFEEREADLKAVVSQQRDESRESLRIIGVLEEEIRVLKEKRGWYRRLKSIIQ